MKKIIDSFIFFNEFDMLKLRLNYLNDVVDYFLICECNHTHSAIPKSYYLDEIIDSIPEDIRKKIIRIKYEVDGRYYYNDAWRLESEHRSFIGKNLNQFQPSDIIMISDLDEIPKKEYLNEVFSAWNEDSLYVGKFDMFHYNFTTCVSLNSWTGTILCSVKKCIELGSDVLHKNRGSNWYEIYENCGWHFSYFGDPEKIKLKIKSFAHQEINTNEYTNEEKILNSIKNKQCFYDENISFSEYKFENYPKDLRDIITNIFPKEFYNL